MGRRFFNSETGIWRFFGWIGDLVILSLLWTLCSVALITTGAAATALYDSVAHNMRRHETGVFSRFFGTFRRELKGASATTLLWGLAAGLLIWLYRTLALQGQVITLYSVVFLLLALSLFGVLSWVFPLLSRFTFGVSALNRTAVRLAMGHALRTAAMGLALGGGIWLVLRNVFSVFFVPGLFAWLSSFLIEPVFDAYAAREPEQNTEES